jgi:hypothetical protein
MKKKSDNIKTAGAAGIEIYGGLHYANVGKLWLEREKGRGYRCNRKGVKHLSVLIY